MATYVKIQSGPSLLDLMLSDYHRKEDSNLLFPAEHDSHPVFFSGDVKCFITGGDLVETEDNFDAIARKIPKGARFIRGWGNNGRYTLSRFDGWYDCRTRKGLIKFSD